jgi:hypothetical protein
MLEELLYVRWNSLIGVYDRKVTDLAAERG